MTTAQTESGSGIDDDFLQRVGDKIAEHPVCKLIHKVSANYPLAEKIQSIRRRGKCPWYVFGGYVRDTIAGIEPNDLDTHVHPLCFWELIHQMQECDNVSLDMVYHPGDEIRNVYSHYNIQICIDDVKYKVDVVCTFTLECDYTCNNLLYDPFTGEIRARHFPKLPAINTSRQFTRCDESISRKDLIYRIIGDIFAKRLCRVADIEDENRFRIRLYHMKRKGYSFPPK